LEEIDLPDDEKAELRLMLLFNDTVDIEHSQREVLLSKLNLPAEDLLKLRNMLGGHATGALSVRQWTERFLEDVGANRTLAHSLVGTSVGTFELVDFIGEGGSSVVFRAERAVGSGKQVVALKLLRTGLYSEGAQRRFRREQAILAQLTHANIARLIEGGVSASGIPYIAMELVEGRPITLEADMQCLSLRQRLTLFVGLCRTIDAAHSNLIVHRDLKPSNIFITRDGILKVLDFGIAKITDSEDADTQTLSLALTPDYAAPEQFAAVPLTTAVDVFSLGVVLSELIANERLRDAVRLSSVLKQRVEFQPPPGLPPRTTLVQLLRGDIDSILVTALQVSPDRRYRNAGAFADDVERYLAGMPVRAHPATTWYGARKFIRRNRKTLAGVAILMSTLIAFLLTAVWQARIARQQAQRASEQAQRAQAISDFLVSLFDAAGADHPRDSKPSLEETIEHATTKLEESQGLSSATRADLYLTLAKVARSEGLNSRALTLVDQTELAGGQTHSSDDTLLLDALVLRATIFSNQARRAEAIALLEPLVLRLRDRHDAIGAQGLVTLGVTLAHAGRTEEGLAILRDVEAMALNGSEKARDIVLSALVNEAWQLLNAERFREGLDRALLARQFWISQGSLPSQSAIELLGAEALGSDALGDPVSAESSYRECIVMRDRFFDRNNTSAAWVFSAYGDFLVSWGRPEEAKPYVELSLQLSKTAHGEADPRTLSSLVSWAELSFEIGDLRHAQSWAIEGVKTCELKSIEHLVCARLLATYGRVEATLGYFESAAKALDKALLSARNNVGETPALAFVLQRKTTLELLQHNYADALADADSALSINDGKRGGTFLNHLLLKVQRAQALGGLGEDVMALKILETVERELADKCAECSARSYMFAAKASSLSRLGRKDEAKKAAQQAMQYSRVRYDETTTSLLRRLAHGR